MPEPGPEPSRPPWEKPDFVVPGSAAVDLALLRTDEAAVTIGLLRAYTTGFEFTVDARSRRAGRSRRVGLMPRRYAPEAETEDGLRLGLEFPDGRRADFGASYPGPDRVEPNAVVVLSVGGGGSGQSWHAQFWVHPLPPPGSLSFVAAWPEFGVTEARVELDAEVVLSAAARATVLWPEEPGAPLGGA